MSVRHKRVRVVCRVKNKSSQEAEATNLAFSVIEKDKTIVVRQLKDSRHGLINNQNETLAFKFDELLHKASQEETFSATTLEVVEEALQGYNGTIMAYGQTGAGKTFTMTGSKQQYHDRGIIPRVLSLLFRAKKAQGIISIKMSYVEIYNEKIYDLLGSGDAYSSSSELHVAELRTGETVIRGALMIDVESEEEALEKLFEGETNRAIAEHQLNDASSRSHCLLTLHIDRAVASDGIGSDRVLCKLNLVDLAGSERIERTKAQGDTLKESLYINKSLSFLEQVVIALTDKNREHIPYRQTTITNVLKDSLGGNSNTVLIACVWPEQEHVDQTISTLKFATRMMSIKIKPVLNVQKDVSAYSRKLEAENQLLKAELALYDELLCNDRKSKDCDDAVDEDAMRSSIVSFVADSSYELEVISVKQVKAMYRLFREICLTKKFKEESNPGMISESVGRALIDESIGDTLKMKSECVGAHNSSQSENCNRVSSSVTGASAVSSTDRGTSEYSLDHTSAEEVDCSRGSTDRAKTLLSSWKDEFLATVGSAGEEELRDIQTQCHSQKAYLRQAASEVNQYKSAIDALLAKKESIQSSSEPTEGKELETFREIKEAKKAYRLAYERLNDIKAKVKYLKAIRDEHRRRQVLLFRKWAEDRALVISNAEKVFKAHDEES